MRLLELLSAFTMALVVHGASLPYQDRGQVLAENMMKRQVGVVGNCIADIQLLAEVMAEPAYSYSVGTPTLSRVIVVLLITSLQSDQCNGATF
jgi:cobalamin synthase